MLMLSDLDEESPITNDQSEPLKVFCCLIRKAFIFKTYFSVSKKIRGENASPVFDIQIDDNLKSTIYSVKSND